MADLSTTHKEIYKDIRGFILGLFPGSEQQVIQALQNNSPLPYGAIVMQVLFAASRDTAVVTDETLVGDEPDAVSIQNSVEVRLQLDFYGPDAEPISRVVNNLWRTQYGCEKLKVCQPLYVQSYNRHPYVNDSNQYEDRWILDVGLQYNPQVTVGQDFTNSAPNINITPVTE